MHNGWSCQRERMHFLMSNSLKDSLSRYLQMPQEWERDHGNLRQLMKHM
jgi:hypothetical protein